MKDLKTLSPIVEYEKLLLSYKTKILITSIEQFAIFEVNYSKDTTMSIKIKTLETIRDFILTKLPTEDLPTFLDFAHDFYLS